MVVETQDRTDGERLAVIEATLPHLATRADVERGLAALERRMLWAGIGFAVGIAANIIVSLLT